MASHEDEFGVERLHEPTDQSASGPSESAMPSDDVDLAALVAKCSRGACNSRFGLVAPAGAEDYNAHAGPPPPAGMPGENALCR